MSLIVRVHNLYSIFAGYLAAVRIIGVSLKDPSQPPPFSMPSKLLILHGKAKSYCFTVSCVPESMFHYL